MNVLDSYQSILLERFNPRVGEDLLTIEGEMLHIMLEPLDLRKVGFIEWCVSSLTLQTFWQPTGGCYVTSGHRASRSSNTSLGVER